MIYKWSLLFLISLFGCFIKLYGQISSPKDSLTLEPRFQNAVVFYNQSLGVAASLYSGREYPGYDYRIKGHQYYHTDELLNGSLKYNGILYEDVLMRYELVKDIIIVTHPANDFRIILKKDDVEWFRINNHLFAPFTTQQLKGFYDIISIGENEVLVKRTKQIEEKIIDKTIVQEFIAKDKYYIKKGEQLYAVSGKRTLLNYSQEHKKDIRKMLKDENIVFRKHPESAIIAAMEYLEKLSSK